ncbi:HipA family kinase [Weissella confusa]|uniref:HipA family kinase n=1 Tax=Weissella confusa TaxID=1583 RepID=UPI0030ED4042
MYIVNDIIRQLPGTTKPYLVSAVKKESAELTPEYFVIKFIQEAINEEVSGKILFNELLGTKLGEHLGLPVMQGEFFELTQQVIDSSEDLTRLKAKPGVCYGTKYLDGQTSIMSPKALKQVKNKKDFGSIIFYDQFLLNIDRGANRGNWFIDVDLNLRAFDFTQIFGGVEHWNKFSLEHLQENPPSLVESMDDLEYRYLADSIQSPQCFLDINRRLKNISFQDYFNDIPQNWDISLEDKNAAIQLLEFQRFHSDDIVRSLKSKFTLR